MKKVLIIGASCILTIAFILAVFCISYWVDDYALSVYREEVEKSLSEVPEVTVLEVVSGCGNSSGTGDHTELCVAVLIETALDKDDIRGKVADITDIYDVYENGYKTLVMDRIDLRFKEENYNGSVNCYILEFLKRAPCSSLDFRGC